jgi:hypothetical protein
MDDVVLTYLKVLCVRLAGFRETTKSLRIIFVPPGIRTKHVTNTSQWICCNIVTDSPNSQSKSVDGFD